MSSLLEERNPTSSQEENKENILDKAKMDHNDDITSKESSDESKGLDATLKPNSTEAGNLTTTSNNKKTNGDDDISSQEDLKKHYHGKEQGNEEDYNGKSPPRATATGLPLMMKQQREEKLSYNKEKDEKFTENCNPEEESTTTTNNKEDNLLSCRDLNNTGDERSDHFESNAVEVKSKNKNKTTESIGKQESRSNEEKCQRIISNNVVVDTSPHRDMSAFVEGEIENFWECSYCNMLPFPWRATGSVVFCTEKPTIDVVSKHLSVCQGKKPLRIPRNAAIKMKRNNINSIDASGASILVSWNHDCESNILLNKSTTSRVKRRASALMDSSSTSTERNLVTKRVKKHHSKENLLESEVKTGVDDDLLATPEDKKFTTDFAYYTVLQLKKCYLTKAGGSRASCPVGYPGLACGHCAGQPNERRFFYTSSDHLRNSFSHIPSHIMLCNHCPDDVKAKLEEYKSVRNNQKSLLKTGDHKIFIDRIWTKLHGEGGGAIVQVSENEMNSPANEDEDVCSNEMMASSQEKLVFDIKCNPNDDYICESLDGQFLESKEIAIETSSSAILSPADKKLSTSYVFYSLLQMVPKKYYIDTNGDIHDQSQPSTDTIRSFDNKKESATSIVENESKNVGTPSNKVHLVASSPNNQNKSEEQSRCSANDNLIVDAESNKKKDDNRTDFETVHILETLVCKHCLNENKLSFVPESAEDLYLCFHNIPGHILKCHKCPSDVKNKLQTLKAFRPIQEAFLEKGAQKKLIDNVWTRVKNHFKDPDQLPRAGESAAKATKVKKQSANSSKNKGGGVPPPPTSTSATYSKDVLSTQLLSDSDRALVSDFTFYTMEQMEPCVLENSGNGSRSMFAFGFPGLGCKYCANQQNARKFFYRTPEILSGNYAHIPNHIFSCKYTPAEVKQILAEKKKFHQSQKQRLHRGSQRVFFNNIFDRLHLKIAGGTIHPNKMHHNSDRMPTDVSSDNKY
jgi:AAA ATPase containing von Willebrand factor type A (vWA) domain